MPVTIGGKPYYRITEVCKIVGIGRSTLLRWFRSGILKDIFARDRRGWRLFSQDDIQIIKDEAHRFR